MALTRKNKAPILVVRVRETQEYDIEVTTTTPDGSLGAARQARVKFLDMMVKEQSANSVGITSRVFEVGGEEFDDDELAPEK